MAIARVVKSVAKATLPSNTIEYLKRMRLLLRGEVWPPVPFDNLYPWLNYTFSNLLKLNKSAYRPQYVWGVAQGAALAKVLGLPKVSVIEFGVAGGFGLLALERISEAIERRIGIGIDVFGFDSGVGLPKPEDFRDQPNMWFEGQLPMDKAKLEPRLHRAKLCLGPVKETVPAFIAGNPAPVAFISFDLDLYSSTRDALLIFKSNYAYLLPRVVSYFDDICGYTYNEYCGERAAITEFNSSNSSRKICPIHGLRYFIPRFARGDLWPDGMYLSHFFEHPLYNRPDTLTRCVSLDIDGTWVWRDECGVTPDQSPRV
jgi:hypothetical protein